MSANLEGPEVAMGLENVNPHPNSQEEYYQSVLTIGQLHSSPMPRQVSATEWLGTQQPRPLSFYHGTIILTTSTQEFYMVKRRWQVSDKDILNKCGDLGALLGEHGRVYGLHDLSSSYGAEVKMTSKEQRSGLGSQFVP